jgi:hypothetical protein
MIYLGNLLGFVFLSFMMLLGFEAFVSGFALSELFNVAGFSVTRALVHQINLSSSIRIAGASSYTTAMNYISQVIHSFHGANKMKNGMELNLQHWQGTIHSTDDFGWNHIQQDANHSILSIKNKHFQIGPPLVLFVQLETGDSGHAYYESTIYIAALLEAIQVLVSDEAFVLNSPIHIAFVSGLYYINSVLDTFVSTSYLDGDFLFLSGFGTERPWTLVSTSDYALSVLTTLSRIPGVIIDTSIGSVYTFFTGKSLGHPINYRLNGAEMSFIGNPTRHRTSFDIDQSRGRDLAYVGQRLLAFIRSHKRDISETSVAAVGMAPVVLLIDRDSLPTISNALIVMGTLLLFWLFDWKAIPSFLRDLGRFCIAIIGCIIFWLLYGCALHSVNPGSYLSRPWTYSIVLTLTAALLIASTLSLSGLERAENVRIIRLTGYVVTARLLRDSDLMLHVGISMFTIICAELPLWIPRVFLEFTSVVPVTFSFGLMYKMLALSVQSIPTVWSDVAPLGIVFAYALHVVIAGLPFSLGEGFFKVRPSYTLLGALILITFFLMKPFSHSSENLVTGTFTQFIFSDTPRSVLTFIPAGGKKHVPSIVQGMKQEEHQTYRAKCARNRLMTADQPCFFKVVSNASLPAAFFKWPTLEFRSDTIEDGIRLVTFHIANLRDRAEAVMFAIYCPNGTRCVRKWDGRADVNYIKTTMAEATVPVRVAGVSRKFNMSFELAGDAKVLIDVLYSVSKNTYMRSAFMGKYRTNVQHSSKVANIGGTVFVESSSY